ncbi:MAG: hypothetical protein RL375_1219, partial [Pseudomonadota bacterium]
APRLDLDGNSGSSSNRAANVSTNGEAVSLSSQPAVAESGTISKIDIEVNAAEVALTTGERITLIGQDFNLDGSDLPASFVVSGVTWKPTYDTAAHKLVFTATGAGTTSSNIQSMLANMQYVNTTAPGGARVLTMAVHDASGNKSNTATTTLSFDQAGPVIDLDGDVLGTGRVVTLNTASGAQSGVLLGATPSVTDSSSLASLKIAVSGLLNGDSEVLTLGTTEIRADGAALPGSVSDGSNTWAVTYGEGTFTFAPASGTFSAASAQTLLQTLGFKNKAGAPSDGVRMFDITATDQHGLTGSSVRSRVTINLALPAVAAVDPLVTLDPNGDGRKDDAFTLKFSEPVKTSLVTLIDNWTLSGGASLGTGATIEALSAVTLEGETYAASYRVTGGVGRSYTTGTTLTLAASQVVDTTAAQATQAAVFTMTDIVAPGRVAPPEAIGVDNYIRAAEASVATTYTFTASADNHRIRYYVNGIELAGKAQLLTAGQTSAVLTMSLADWGSAGAKSVYARLEDAAGNLGDVGISKSVIVDTTAETSFASAITTEAGAAGPTAGDILTLNFVDKVAITWLSGAFGTGATFGAVGGTPAPGTTAPFYSDTWRVTLGSLPAVDLAGGAAVQIGVRDVAGNVATISTTLPASIYDLPGQALIRSVTTDNVLTAAEFNQTVTLDLTAAKAGDIVRLYLDGKLLASNTLASAAATTSFNLTAADWGADGERVLTATIARGSTVVTSDFKRSVHVSADGAHWSVANGANTSIWFDPDTLALSTGSQIATWNASVGGSVATQSSASRRPTLESGSVHGHNQLFFDGGGDFSNPAAANTDFLVFTDPNRITGTTRAERNVAMFVAGAAQSSTYGNALARSILNLGYFAGSGAAPDARAGVFSIGTVYNGNSLAGNAFQSTGTITLGGDLINTTSSGVYFTEVLRYAASTNTYTLLANDQRLTQTSATDAFLNTSDASAGQGNPLMIGSANYGSYVPGGGAGSWYGNVGDVIALVTPAAVTDNQMIEIQTYLAAKYRTTGVEVSQTTGGVYDLSVSRNANLLIDNITVLNTSESNDVIVTAGADHVNAGAGSDKVQIKDLAFRHLDGGLGADTLQLHADYVGASSIVLADFVSNARGLSGNATADARVLAAGWHKLQGFEQIDLAHSSRRQVLTVSATDVNQLSETNTLGVILGDNDVLHASGFAQTNPVWGYFTVGGQIYTQRHVDASGQYTLYAIGGNGQPQLGSASYSGQTLTLGFNEMLSGTASASDWQVQGGVIQSLTLGGSDASTLGFTLDAIAPNST